MRVRFRSRTCHQRSVAHRHFRTALPIEQVRIPELSNRPVRLGHDPNRSCLDRRREIWLDAHASTKPGAVQASASWHQPSPRNGIGTRVAARALLDSPPAPPETTMLRILAILPFLWAGAAFAAGPVFDVHVHLHAGEKSLLAYEAEAETAGIELAGLGAMWFGGPHQAMPGELDEIRAGQQSTTKSVWSGMRGSEHVSIGGGD